MGKMLKIRNFTQSDRHLTPPLPPPSKPGEPMIPAIPGVVLARCKGTPGLPDHRPSETEISEEALRACISDRVVRAWFLGENPELEVRGDFDWTPPAKAPAKPVVDPEKEELRARLAELTDQRNRPVVDREKEELRSQVASLTALLDKRTNPAPRPPTRAQDAPAQPAPTDLPAAPASEPQK